MTSYAALLRLDWLGETRWRLAVVDEAQAIKRRPARLVAEVARCLGGVGKDRNWEKAHQSDGRSAGRDQDVIFERRGDAVQSMIATR